MPNDSLKNLRVVVASGSIGGPCAGLTLRAVKWGMAYYGVDWGWCFSSGAFVGHMKLMFIRGTEIEPEPPVTPIGMGKSTRGVELASVGDFEERQLASWMKHAATMPSSGKEAMTTPWRSVQDAGRGKRCHSVSRGSRIPTQKNWPWLISSSYSRRNGANAAS